MSNSESASLGTAEILFPMLRPYLEGRSWSVTERSERYFCIESPDYDLSLFCRLGQFSLVLFSNAPENKDDELFRFSDCRKDARETFVKLARRISELPNVQGAE